MKSELNYIRKRPLAFISLIILAVFYVMMIFADFFAPYSATKTFEQNTFHPANVKITKHGICAQEARVLNRVTWKYAYVKDYYHKIEFFVHGSSYKILGLFETDIHLYGTKPDTNGNVYPVYLMGADNLGRDMFSRMVMGSRISLTIGFVATAVSLLLSVILGGLAGFYGGKTDWTIMRFAEFFMLIPGIYLILFLRSLLNTKMDSGTSYMIITLILSLVGWPSSARTIRGMVHAIKREEYVTNAGLEGIPTLVIIFKYVIPQITSLLIVSTTLSVPGFIMSETTLSYLGLGIADPAVSWGSMINKEISTLSNLSRYPWLLNPVWLLLAVTLGFNFLGDALRDYYDPFHVIFPTWKRAKEKLTRKIKVAYQEKDVLLSIRNLRVYFHSIIRSEENIVNAVKGISYDVKRSEILGIVGESGSGKSVSTTAVAGLLPQNAVVSGDIIFDGINLMSLTQSEFREYRGKRIGMILQEPGRSFDPLQTMGSVFLEVYRNMDSEISKEEAYSKAAELLREVGLPDPEKRLENYPHQFSGGQLQRIGIALALAQGCELLIADEPTTALDVTIQMQIVSLLVDLKNKRNLSIIFITHDIDLVSRIADRLIVMRNGEIVETGETKTLLKKPQADYTKELLAAVPKFGTHYTDEPKAKKTPAGTRKPKTDAGESTKAKPRTSRKKAVKENEQ